MAATSPVGTFGLTNYASMSGTAYPLQIDANSAVAQRSIDLFAPRPAGTPNMTVVVDPGHVLVSASSIRATTWNRYANSRGRISNC